MKENNKGEKLEIIRMKMKNGKRVKERSNLNERLKERKRATKPIRYNFQLQLHLWLFLKGKLLQYLVYLYYCF